MKKILFLFLLVPFLLKAGDNDQRVEAPISGVTVYLAGAEITHTKSISLMPGRNELQFVGLSSKLVPKSIQFTASGDVSILSISNKIDYLYGALKTDSKVKVWTDSLTMMNDLQSVVLGQIDAYTREYTMLQANQSVGGDNGVTNADLKTNADFFLTRFTEINTALVKLRRKQIEQQEVITRLSNQITEANSKTNPPMGEITILVYVAGTIKVESETELRYVVSDAGWAPSYDLIAEDVDKPITVKYRAKVFNNTDVDWKDVKMKLSTSDPMQTAAAPVLNKWTLNFENDYNTYGYQQQQYYNNGYANANADGDVSQTLSSQNLANSAPRQAATINTGTYDYQPATSYQQTTQVQVQYNQIQISELSAEFDIKIKYDVPADGKPYIVDVTSYDLNATFQYQAAPKADRDAFLMARITGWEDLDLVEGPANVYFGGTYVGQSYIYTRSTDDTLDLSFGRDNKLVLTRTQLQELNNDKGAGTTKKETYSYEIAVKNTRKGMVNVKLQDQIPISQDAEIVVEATELSKGELDPATGMVTWSLNVPPGETVKVKLTYSIKYPKNKIVRTKKFKTVSAPSF
ncbi:MAG TPA: DUF4139 domain-containing protein [Bacteroidia bacterium]|jgi:uncharacterized protein (TIGR02231 family)|nr:DUF4139 domain-containing protein [Bacteroidia bacterium]